VLVKATTIIEIVKTPHIAVIKITILPGRELGK